MANTKISQLPSYTGTAADLRWFVMNNSGETETYKYSGYTSQVIPVSGKTGSYKTINYTGNSISCINSIIFGGDNDNTITSTDATGRNTIVGGNGNSISTGFGNGIFNGIGATITANQSTIVGGQGTIGDGFGNGLFGGVGNVGGNYSAIVAGYGNIIGATFNDRDVIAGGQNNIFYNASNSFIGGGSENDVYGATVAVVAGYNNTLSTGNLVFVAGTQDNTITQPGYTYALIGGGYNTVNNQNNSAGNAMYSSYFCSDTTANDNSVLGNSNNWFSGSRNSNLSGYGKFNHITNTYNSSITNNAGADVFEWFNKIDSSSGSTITTSKQSQILGGIDNTISGKTRAVMIGTSGRTADADNTTYVEKLKALGKNIEITDGTNTTSNIIGNLIIGKNNTLSQDKYNIVMGESNNVSGAGAPGVQGSFVNGLGNQLGTYAYGCLVFGGYNNITQPYNIRWGNNGSTFGSSNLTGGEQNVVEGNACIAWGDYINLKANYQQSFGNNNDITSTAAYQGIYGGQNNLISSTDGFNFMLGGSGNTISGGTFVSMIGTSGRTGTLSATTHVENLHTYRTPSTEVQSVVSGTTFTCNLNNGAKSQFYITGTSTINITNVRDGASFMIKTETDGNYVMTWTATGGYTFKFDDGGQNPGNTTIDIWAFEVFGNVIYGSRRHNFV